MLNLHEILDGTVYILCNVSLCLYVWVLGMSFLLGIFNSGDIIYHKEKMNNGPHINAIYHYVAYKNTHLKKVVLKQWFNWK